MSTQQTQSKAIAETVNQFDQLYPRHVGGAKYSVLSTRNDSVTAHTVNIEQLTCTCEDEAYNTEGNEICDHVAVALHSAPKRLKIELEAFQFILEAMQTVNHSRGTPGQRYPADEVMIPSEADSNGAGAPDEASNGSDQATVEAAVGSVEAWLVDIDVDHDPIQVLPGDHDGTDGVRIDWMKADLGEKDHEYLKSKINGIDGTSYHAGWMDDGCQTCGLSDGEGFYHVPVDVAKGL